MTRVQQAPLDRRAKQDNKALRAPLVLPARRDLRVRRVPRALKARPVQRPRGLKVRRVLQVRLDHRDRKVQRGRRGLRERLPYE